MATGELLVNCSSTAHRTSLQCGGCRCRLSGTAKLLDIRSSLLQVCQSLTLADTTSQSFDFHPNSSLQEEARSRLLAQHRSPSQADVPRQASTTTPERLSNCRSSYLRTSKHLHHQNPPAHYSVVFGHLGGAVKGDAPEPDTLD